MRLIDADALVEALKNDDLFFEPRVYELIESATTVHMELNKRSYPKDCPVSDFHCTYPECSCGR